MERSSYGVPKSGTGRLVPALAGLLVVAALAACGGGPGAEAADDRLQVVATTGMIADMAERVAGDRARVEGLMGPGVDPHLYKASAGDVRSLRQADLILYNGLHLEAAMGEVLEEMGQRRPTVAVADSVPRDSLIETTAFSGTYDPHIWFHLPLWERALRAVAAAFIRVDPAGDSTYRANAAAFRDTLRALDDWVRERTGELAPDERILVTAHDAFGYFGRAYGFEVHGLQGISTASEAGTADVRRLVDFIIREEVPAIFVETSIPRRTVEAVQKAVRSKGAEVEIGGSLFSDAMGTAGTPEGEYPGMVRHNVNTIVNALRTGEGETR